MIKINLGCGQKYKKGYINCDFNKKIKADFYFDMEEPNWPFEDNYVDNIYAAHCLEHLSKKGYINALKEIYRISKHEAELEIVFPHYLSSSFFNDPTHQTAITIQGLQLFDQEMNQYTIDNNYADSTLGLDLNINFKIIDSISYVSENNSFIKTNENLEELADHYFNIFDHVYVKLKVVKE